MNTIKFWLVTLISLLVVLAMLVLSLTFYREFQQALDQRVLLQLTSIKRLKRVQLEEFINTQWKEFNADPTSYPHLYYQGAFAKDFSAQIDTACLQTLLNNNPLGEIFDLSNCEPQQPRIGFIKQVNDTLFMHVLDMDRIQQILLERTGMGETGETYLVGSDYQLRSRSRFFPMQNPLTITAKTVGVTSTLDGKPGTSIIDDYRGIPVYSAYNLLDLAGLNWVILSEIDVEEVTIPLVNMRNKLILIFVLVCLSAVALSLFLAGFLSKPLIRMRNWLDQMTRGNYSISIEGSGIAREIQEMYQALESLRNSIKGAIQFSSQVGNMNLDTQHKLSGQYDQLGKSLITMQEKLREYAEQDRTNQQLAKKSLIIGEEKERKRLARELHDGLGPLLTSLKLTIQRQNLHPEVKKEVNQMIDHTVREIRRMTYDLMPPALQDFGAGKALSNFVDMISKTSEVTIHFEDGTLEEHSRITSDIDICLFRVSQEMINNSLKHADCTKIALTLTEFEHAVCLFYQDDGKGFETGVAHEGSGLRNIRERVAVFDGYVHISSSDQGTQIEIEIPLHESD